MISFIYFDVGGVAMLDFSKTDMWEDLKKELGIRTINNQRFEEIWKEHELEICLNRDVDSLLPLLRKNIKLTIPENYSLLEGFIKRFRVNPEIWPLINELKRKYRIGLLTNMYPRMLDELIKQQLLQDLDWDVVIDSSKVGLQKPDPKIFALAMERAGVKPEEILFVENSDEHIQAAKEAGWQTFLYDPSNIQVSTKVLREHLCV
jgi:epoxide hydrolase-like predicted phosphatase